MRLLKLQFTNINSLAGSWEIDFTDPAFARSGLFAITGPTGSGKSSILDAVSLALYGETPRLRDAAVKFEGDDACPVMTKGTGLARAAVRFEAGGREYLSVWSRRVKRTGKLSEKEVELVSFSSPDDAEGTVMTTKISEWSQEIVRITNMTFDIFTRSVLLAQGAFSNFLKAGDDSRANILEKITGTNIYSEISRKIYVLAKEERIKLEKLEIARDSLDLLPDEERASLGTEAASLAAALPALKAKTEKLNEALRWRMNLDRLIAETSLRQTAARHAADAEAHFAPQLDAARRAREALLPARAFRRLEEETRQAEALQKALADLAAEEKTLGERRPAAEKAAEDAERAAREAEEKAAAFEPQYKAMLEADTELRALKTQCDDALRAAKAAGEESVAACEAHQAAKKAADSLNEEAASLQTRLEAGSADDALEGPLALLEETRRALALNSTHYQKAAADLKTLEAGLSAARAQADEAEKSLQERKKAYELARAALHDAETAQTAAAAGSTLEKTLEAMRTVTEALAEARMMKTLLDDRAAFEATREALSAAANETPAACWWEQSGEPLLAQYAERFKTHLTEADRLSPGLETRIASDFEGTVAELESRRADLTRWSARQAEAARTVTARRQGAAAAERAAQDAALLRETLQKALAQQELSAQQLTLELERRRADRRTLIEKLCADAKPILGELDPETVKPSVVVKAVKDRVDARRTLRAAAEETAARRQRALETLARASEAAAQAQKRSADQNEAAKAAETALSGKRARRADLFGETDPEKTHLALAESLRAARRSLQTRQSERDALLTRMKELAASRSAREDEAKKLSEKRRAAEAELQTLLREKGFARPEDALAAERSEAEIVRTETQARRLTEARAATEGEARQAQDAERREAERALTDESAQALGPQAELAGKEAEEAARRLIEIETALKADEKRRTEAETMMNAITAQRARASEWAALSDLIGSADGKKFRTAAQKITFRILIRYANEAMQTMSGRYRLLVSGENGMSVDVADFDMGSRVRTSQNLSGGETFLVSLALALGLSRMGGENLRVDTLFLDEGFGTLDENTLNKALYALETLQSSSGKLIGVISHVQSVRDRIDAHITVKAHSGSGRSSLSGPGVRALLEA